MKFVDEVEIQIASGKGGAGSVSFRREAMVARGGPDGGDGGRGGDVIFRVENGMSSLLDHRFQRKYKAGDGEPGKGANCHGADGADVIIAVPPGTVLKDLDGNLIRDMGKEGELVFLEGGIGGKGNTFYKTSVNQAPGVAQKGMPGKEMSIRLELKLLADVGLVGMPNAGKSTLISAISAARPKVADYPFTTLTPQLGVVRFGDEKNFVVADIPGLIKGASEGVGLGTQFLRHIERTKLFVHLVDVSMMSSQDPVEAYNEITAELVAHDKKKSGEQDYIPLSDRPQIVVLNKIDLLSDVELRAITQRFKSEVGVEVMSISAATRKGLKELVIRMGTEVYKESEK